MSAPNTFDVLFLPSGLKGQFAAGTPLLDAARELGIGIESICGGTGACAKCKCQVLDGTFDDEGHELSMGHMVTTSHGLRSRNSHVTPATEHEQKLTRKHQFKHGERLGCQTRVLGDAVVFIPGARSHCAQSGWQTDCRARSCYAQIFRHRACANTGRPSR